MHVGAVSGESVGRCRFDAVGLRLPASPETPTTTAGGPSRDPGVGSRGTAAP